MRAGLGRAGSAAFINTHTLTLLTLLVYVQLGFLPRVHLSRLCCGSQASAAGTSLGFRSDASPSDHSNQPLTRLPSSSHVQLQLLPGQVWPQGEGASAPIQREELRLLHEDHLLIFLSDPVPHHRLSGALPHLRTTRTISGGEESQGQCEDPPQSSNVGSNVDVLWF